MATDLSRAIREALRSDQIAAVDLHQPALRAQPRTRRTGRVLAVSASVAVVAAIAVVLAVTVPGRSAGPSPAGEAQGLAGVVGYRWQVTEVQDAQGSIAVPASLGAVVGFTRDGYVLGEDTVNSVSGRYRQTADGYAVRFNGTTLVLYVGKDPIRLRIIAAIDRLFDGPSAGVRGAFWPPIARVSARRAGHTLTLRRGATTVTLTRAGMQPDLVGRTSATPAASPAATSKGAAGSATIAGRLLAVGGPPGTPAHPLSGTVILTGLADHQQHPVAAGTDGRYTAAVPAGTYEIVGHSPQYGSGTYTCKAAGPLRVAAGGSAHADVYCQER